RGTPTLRACPSGPHMPEIGARSCSSERRWDRWGNPTAPRSEYWTATTRPPASASQLSYGVRQFAQSCDAAVKRHAGRERRTLAGQWRRRTGQHEIARLEPKRRADVRQQGGQIDQHPRSRSADLQKIVVALLQLHFGHCATVERLDPRPYRAERAEPLAAR